MSEFVPRAHARAEVEKAALAEAEAMAEALIAEAVKMGINPVKAREAMDRIWRPEALARKMAMEAFPDVN